MRYLTQNLLVGIETFANDKSNMTPKLEFALGRVENIVGKRRKCWLPAFSPFPTVFSIWLVVLGFYATLTAMVISWRWVTHMCFLAFSHQY